MHRTPRSYWTLLLLAACVGAADRCDAAAAAKPNIVMVFIDDMGWGDLSCFGGQELDPAGPQTENIDRLAEEGIRFTQFYVNSPICSPSRCALTTGQYPQRHNITSYLASRRENKRRGVADWLDPKAPTLARALRRAGYATGHFGKWHLGGQRDVGEAPLILRYGFGESLTNFEGLGPRVLPLCDAHNGKAPHPHALGSDKLGRGPVFWRDRAYVTEEFTKAAINFIRAAEHRGEPFYANLWPDDVHSPFFPPEALRGDGAKRALYHGVLDAMDQQLGELFDYIRERPSLRDNTLILVCSDNGPEPGAGRAGPLRGVKGTLYEGGVRSPLIAWGPGVLADGVRGAVNESSVFAAFDIAPTMLALADIDTPMSERFDGEPLPGVIRGESDASRSQPLFFRRPPDRNNFARFRDLPDLAVRDGEWKLLCEYDGSAPELYNLGSDRGEASNVAADYPEVARRLTDAALQWNASMPTDRGPDLE